MGLAILPPHLKTELQAIGRAMASGGDLQAPDICRHAPWAGEILARRQVTAENADDVLREEVGAVFVKCLEHANVFGQSPDPSAAARRFIETLLQRIIE